MTDTVIITIIGRQPEIDSEPTIEKCSGLYALKNGHHFIRYENEGVRTLIKITSDSLSVTRSGKLVSQMDFISGRATSTIYHTPYGDFDTDIFTKAISIAQGAERITVHVIYDLTMTGKHISECDLTIEIKPE